MKANERTLEELKALEKKMSKEGYSTLFQSHTNGEIYDTIYQCFINVDAKRTFLAIVKSNDLNKPEIELVSSTILDSTLKKNLQAVEM